MKSSMPENKKLINSFPLNSLPDHEEKKLVEAAQNETPINKKLEKFPWLVTPHRLKVASSRSIPEDVSRI
jgi:hypothetical protein